MLSGKSRFESINNDIAENEKAIENLNAELSDTENKNKLLKEAKEKLKNTQNTLDKVLKANNATESFEKLRSTLDKTNAATNALNLFDELYGEKSDMYPALMDNGIIALSKDATKTVKAPGVTVNPEYVYRKKLAEKYVQMRNSIIEAYDNQKDVLEFFDHVENSMDCAKIMDLIHDKFVTPLNDMKISGIESQNEMAGSVLLKGVSKIEKQEPKKEEKATISKFFSSLVGSNKQDVKNRAVIENHAEDKLNFMSIENLQDLISERDKAKSELNSMKARLAVTRDPKEIKAEIDRLKQGIEDKKEERRELANNFLEHFELKNEGKDLSFEELFGLCQNKLTAVKTEVKTADDIYSKIDLIKEEETLRKMEEDVSVEKEMKKTRELKEKADTTKKVSDALTKLKKDYDSLFQEYQNLADKQQDVKKECRGVVFKNSFKHITGELSAISAHIGDAKRFVGHKNTQFFTDMADSLELTVTTLNDSRKTREEKIKQLKDLRDYADKYLEEKGKQKFVTNSAMRKDRIAKATLIKNMANEELARQEALDKNPKFQNTKNAIKTMTFDPEINEQEFSAKFKAAQKRFANRENNEPILDGSKVAKENNIDINLQLI